MQFAIEFTAFSEGITLSSIYFDDSRNIKLAQEDFSEWTAVQGIEQKPRRFNAWRPRSASLKL